MNKPKAENHCETTHSGGRQLYRCLKNGFSISEVVVTLLVMSGIILLVNRYVYSSSNQNLFDAKYNKIASSITKNIEKIRLSFSGLEKFEDFDSASEFFIDVVTNNLNAKKCGIYIGTGEDKCWPDRIELLDNVTVQSMNDNNYDYFMLPDKSVIAVQNDNKGSKIYIDVNGLKKPNVFGKDVYEYKFDFKRERLSYVPANCTPPYVADGSGGCMCPNKNDCLNKNNCYIDRSTCSKVVCSGNSKKNYNEEKDECTCKNTVSLKGGFYKINTESCEEECVQPKVTPEEYKGQTWDPTTCAYKKSQTCEAPKNYYNESSKACECPYSSHADYTSCKPILNIGSGGCCVASTWNISASQSTSSNVVANNNIIWELDNDCKWVPKCSDDSQIVQTQGSCKACVCRNMNPSYPLEVKNINTNTKISYRINPNNPCEWILDCPNGRQNEYGYCDSKKNFNCVIANERIECESSTQICLTHLAFDSKTGKPKVPSQKIDNNKNNTKRSVEDAIMNANFGKTYCYKK